MTRALLMSALVALAIGPSNAASTLCDTCSSAETATSYQARFCKGMEQNQRFQDQTEVACLSDEYAIEIDFTPNWPAAVGLSLHSAMNSGKRPGIILVCKLGDKTSHCFDHGLRLQEVIAQYDLPITAWQCGSNAATLDDCRRVQAP